MDRKRRIFERFEKALGRFEEAVKSGVFSFLREDVVVEITTKRFEYTYEVFWKLLQVILRERGVICNSPRSCFEEAVKEGIISEEYEEVFMNMIKMRNSLVHIYSEESAKKIYDEIKQSKIIEAFKSTMENIKKFL